MVVDLVNLPVHSLGGFLFIKCIVQVNLQINRNIWLQTCLLLLIGSYFQFLAELSQNIHTFDQLSHVFYNLQYNAAPSLRISVVHFIFVLFYGVLVLLSTLYLRHLLEGLSYFLILLRLSYRSHLRFFAHYFCTTHYITSPHLLVY